MMILRPVSPASPLGPPISNRPVGLTSTGTRRVDARLAQHRVDDVVLDVRGEQCLEVDLGRVLRRDHHGVRRPGCPRRSRASPGSCRPGAGTGAPPIAAPPRACGPAVRRQDRHRHELRGLPARIAEHQALVPGALHVVVVGEPSSRCSKASFTPWAISGDCEPIETLPRKTPRHSPCRGV